MGDARDPRRGYLEPTSVAAALDEALGDIDALETTERECLVAWLSGFRHHWPDSFDAILGRKGELALECLETRPVDPNRYLKLRRIAIENLAVLV